MVKYVILFSIFIIISCNKNELKINLEDYLEANSDLEIKKLDVFAMNTGSHQLNGAPINNPVQIHFFPEEDYFDLRYFETRKAEDQTILKKYRGNSKVSLNIEPYLNGELIALSAPSIDKDKFAIITFKANGKLYVSESIILKEEDRFTLFGKDSVDVTEDSTSPTFSWSDNSTAQNSMYLQLISDSMNNLISATYTKDKTFTFNDLSNVILNKSNATIELKPASRYLVSIMGIGQYNWVNLLYWRYFYTN